MHVTSAKHGKTRATKSRLALVLHLIGREEARVFLNQSQSVVKQNHNSNSGLLSTLIENCSNSTIYIFSLDVSGGF